jgi:hypothetical protein
VPCGDLTWVLQRGLGERDRSRLAEAIDALGLRREEVAVVPFSHEAASPLPAIEGPCLVYGSGGLLALARAQGWRPAGWDGDGFSGSRVAEAVGPLALNHGAVLTTWSGTATAARAQGWTRVFVRPDAETKEFAGRVIGVDALEAWVGQLRAVGYLEESDSPALVSPARTLGREWRLFVVERKVVGSSQYARRGEAELGPPAPPNVLAFAGEALCRHAPAPALVLDVAEVWAGGEWQPRVVELNSINSAGLHGCDPGPIVAALSDLAIRGEEPV